MPRNEMVNLWLMKRRLDAWDADADYILGDLLRDGGKNWECNGDSKGVKPSAGTTYRSQGQNVPYWLPADDELYTSFPQAETREDAEDTAAELGFKGDLISREDYKKTTRGTAEHAELDVRKAEEVKRDGIVKQRMAAGIKDRDALREARDAAPAREGLRNRGAGPVSR